MCNQYKDFNLLEDCKNGILYCAGNKVSIEEYLNGKIKISQEKNDMPVLDITEF